MTEELFCTNLLIKEMIIMNTKDTVFLVVVLLLALSVIIMAAPGFEAIFAIAGVLGIAYLFVRRRENKKEAIASE